MHYVTLTMEPWVDVFTRPAYIEILLVRHCQQKKGLDLYAWVVMSNHLHAMELSFYWLPSGFKKVRLQKFLGVRFGNQFPLGLREITDIVDEIVLQPLLFFFLQSHEVIGAEQDLVAK